MLPGVTHDAILGGQALRVAVELLGWLEALPLTEDEETESLDGDDDGDGVGMGVAGTAVAAGEPSVRVLPLHQGLQAPGVDSKAVFGSGAAGGAGGTAAGSGAVLAPEQRASWV